jgi:hypothetical protein
MQVPKILFVALVSHAFLKSASAVVEVFTTLAAWEARVAAATGPPCISIKDLSGPDIILAVGTTDVGLFDATIDSLAGVIIPMGQIGGEFVGWINAIGPTIFNIHNFDNAPIIGFAGDWNSTTNGNRLTVTINNETIKFGDYLAPLPNDPGDGFLGFVDPAGILTSLIFNVENTLSDEGEYFTVDDVRAAGQCPETQ